LGLDEPPLEFPPYWKVIYDSKSDSWELQSDQAFATKKLALEYLQSKLSNTDTLRQKIEIAKLTFSENTQWTGKQVLGLLNHFLESEKK